MRKCNKTWMKSIISILVILCFSRIPVCAVAAMEQGGEVAADIRMQLTDSETIGMDTMVGREQGTSASIYVRNDLAGIACILLDVSADGKKSSYRMILDDSRIPAGILDGFAEYENEWPGDRDSWSIQADEEERIVGVSGSIETDACQELAVVLDFIDTQGNYYSYQKDFYIEADIQKEEMEEVRTLGPISETEPEDVEPETEVEEEGASETETEGAELEIEMEEVKTPGTEPEDEESKTEMEEEGASETEPEDEETKTEMVEAETPEIEPEDEEPEIEMEEVGTPGTEPEDAEPETEIEEEGASETETEGAESKTEMEEAETPETEPEGVEPETEMEVVAASETESEAEDPEAGIAEVAVATQNEAAKKEAEETTVQRIETETENEEEAEGGSDKTDPEEVSFTDSWAPVPAEDERENITVITEEKERIADTKTARSATTASLNANVKITPVKVVSTDKTEDTEKNPGSHYNLDALEEINGACNRELDNLVVYEYNKEKLSEDSIEIYISKNDEVIGLEKDVDFTIKLVGNSDGQKIYKYEINKDIFREDGEYSVHIRSEDVSGHTNKNEEEASSIAFRVDNTAPLIMSCTPTVEQEMRDLRQVRIKDNVGVSDVEIYIDGESIEYDNDGDLYTFAVPVEVKEPDVRVVASDGAGNTYERILENYVTAGKVQLRNSHSSIPAAVLILLAAAMPGLIVLWKKIQRRKKV